MLVDAKPPERLALYPNDTIAAIATATGPASIGIVRLSGPDAIEIAGRLIPSGRPALAARAGHSLSREVIFDPRSGEPIDDALLAVFHAPRSFTGENIVEIQGHGGPITLKLVFSACLAAGARSARPGEFSERAFVSGKMDLAQAEAVAQLVNAKTVASHRAALLQANGSLSHEIRTAAQYLKAALAAIEASIDFPEDVGEVDAPRLTSLLTTAAAPIAALLRTATYGRALTDGISVVLTGLPNVGKSSLFNALSGTDRSIVTEVPGTTRDVIEDTLQIRGIPVRAFDTAGIRETDDPVEKIGVDRARDAVAGADVTVLVVDATRSLDANEQALVSALNGCTFVVAVSKSDLAPNLDVRLDGIRRVSHGASAVVATSAVSLDGIEELAASIARAAGKTSEIDGTAIRNPLIASSRHEDALRRAAAAIDDATATLLVGLPSEMIAVDIHGALQALGEITGETAREDIISSIFATFCIGK